MIVCICQGVSDRVVRLVVLEGATSVESVAARCGAGTDCGSCIHAISDLVEEFVADVVAGARACGAGGSDQTAAIPSSVAARVAA